MSSDFFGEASACCFIATPHRMSSLRDAIRRPPQNQHLSLCVTVERSETAAGGNALKLRGAVSGRS